jgi:hypothetical protein
VVAEEPEIARFAASLVRVEYEQGTHVTDFEGQRGKGTVRGGEEAHMYSRGNAAKAFAQAPVRIEAEYRMPVEHHNPMEMFGATAIWDGGDRITVYDKTQGPQNCRDYVANVFSLRPDEVRVLCPYVGGGFGSGLRPQYELPLAVLAARALKRSVQVALTREQMFTLGYRAANIQSLALAADRDGRLAAFRHTFIGMTSQFEDFQRNSVGWSWQRGNRERHRRYRPRHLYDDDPARRRDAGRAARSRDGQARRLDAAGCPHSTRTARRFWSPRRCRHTCAPCLSCWRAVELQAFRCSSSGSLAKFTAIRRASPLVSRLMTERRCRSLR